MAIGSRLTARARTSAGTTDGAAAGELLGAAAPRRSTAAGETHDRNLATVRRRRRGDARAGDAAGALLSTTAAQRAAGAEAPAFFTNTARKSTGRSPRFSPACFCAATQVACPRLKRSCLLVPSGKVICRWAGVSQITRCGGG